MKKKKITEAKLFLATLLAAALTVTMQPVTTFAAADNPESVTLDAFPAVGESPDLMNVNAGTINTLYGGGTITNNNGTITVSQGSVTANNGSIGTLTAGHVGTNYGSITSITNTGSLGVNDGSGTIGTVGMGNEITRNDGTISENSGIIYSNYGTIGENRGTVTMRDGRITQNYQGATVKLRFTAERSQSARTRATLKSIMRPLRYRRIRAASVSAVMLR